MSLEARVKPLEENHVHWDQVLTGVEGTIALILNEQRDKFKKVDQHLKQQDRRLDKIEELLIQIVNPSFSTYIRNKSLGTFAQELK